MADTQTLLVQVFALTLGVSLHESAHAWTANYFGDPTAKDEGRISLNPMDHIDPIGTVLVPTLLFLSGSSMMFGWAKPVMVNPRNLRNPKIADRWISAAGPISNILLATFTAILFRILTFWVGSYPASQLPISTETIKTIYLLLFFTVAINVVLAIFNMIPIPPLDGSHVLKSFLPLETAIKFENFIQQYGFILIIVLLMSPILDIVHNNLTRPLINLLLGI